MPSIAPFIESVNAFLWGWPLIILILAAGLFLTTRTGAVQFARFGIMSRETFGRVFRRGPRAEGDITAFQAVTVALGGTVGVGNIAGVATAIALGGPGAVFWMWVSGLLGMATKFAEVVLGLHYRKREPGQPMIGGPMRYIEGGLGPRWKWLAMLFSLFGALAAFGIGNMVQANACAEGMKYFGVSPWITGLVMSVAVGAVTLGGLKRIAALVNYVTPFMVTFYMLGGLVVILLNIGQLPGVLAQIVRLAFTPAAATGGFAGAGIMLAMRQGITRGVFSNEAGLGSAPMAHATAMTDHPVRQGLWGIFEVFVVTIIVCTITAFVVLVTGQWAGGEKGATLAMQSFAQTFGVRIGFPLVVINMVLTAYDTNLAWGFYGETCAAYLFGHGKTVRLIYQIIWLPAVVIGAVWALDVVWGIADALNALMAFPNLIALFSLSGVVAALTRGFFAGQPYDAPGAGEAGKVAAVRAR
ncbi:MAG: sodium:alanine symporter family protein [Candidatus Eisenbacteria bacterium]|nr:sodium:alanine symporter family protein [Candidatus Eisenbacteria bacterium]